MSKSVLPMFSSKSFIVFHLTFRSLIHSEFIFGYIFKECPCLVFFFFFKHVAVQYSENHLLKRHLFSTVQSCLLCHRLIGHMCVGLFLGFPSYLIDLYFCFCAVPYCFDDCGFVVQPEVSDPETLLKVYYVTLLPKSPQKDQFLSATMILYQNQGNAQTL